MPQRSLGLDYDQGSNFLLFGKNVFSRGRKKFLVPVNRVIIGAGAVPEIYNKYISGQKGNMRKLGLVRLFFDACGWLSSASTCGQENRLLSHVRLKNAPNL